MNEYHCKLATNWVRSVSFAGLLVLQLSSVLKAQVGTYAIKTQQRNVTGSPLVWDQQKVLLINAYGQFESISFSEVESFKKTSKIKQVFSKSSFEKRLKAEFGDSFRYSNTTDYLVVHPRGSSVDWPQQIQTAYRAFHTYFQSRRVSIRKKTYPLVAVVFKTRAEFDRYAKANNEKISSKVVGYYSVRSNRVLMYDRGSRLSKSSEQTLFHEVAHQAAFNCGIHSRFGETPRWLTEGLGTYFEAKGVWNWQTHRKRSDRINQSYMQSFDKHILRPGKTEWIAELISGNRLFAKNSEQAYGTAWALTFYLMETNPVGFTAFMKQLNGLEPFEKYPMSRRLNDFQTAFGDMDRMEGAIHNYFRKL